MPSVHLPNDRESITLWDRIVQLKMLIWGGVVLLLALGLIYASEKVNGFPSHFLETFGVGLLPIGSFLLIYEYDTRKQYQKMVRGEFQLTLHGMARRCGECERLGLLSLSEKRVPENLVEPFSAAENGHTISVLGVALADLTDFARHQQVLAAIRNGCKVRLLYLDPDCEEAKAHSGEEGRSELEVAGHIKGTEGIWRKDLADGVGGGRLLEIRKYRAIPKHFLLIHPGGVYVGHYLHGRRGNSSPHFLLAPQSILAQQYTDLFEELWSGAQIVS